MSNNRWLYFAFVLIIAMSILGCGGDNGDIINGNGDIIDDNGDVVNDIEDTEDIEDIEDTEDTEDIEGTEDVPDISDLWAPPREGAQPSPDMPKKNEVPYPSYPGAYLYSSVGQQNKCTFVFIETSDSPEEVYVFYQDQMGSEGWTSEETTEEYILWPSDGTQSDAKIANIPSIQIFPIDETRTQIQLLWLP